MNMKPTKKNFTSLVWAVLVLPILLAGVPARAQQPAPGKYRTIDFPESTDTAECCSAILNINNERQIVGGYLDTSGTGHGFLLDDDRFTTIDFPRSIYTEALGINPQGRIVGEYLDAANVSHGFLLKQHVFRTIDFPGAVNSFVNWINSANDMVGGYMDSAGSFHGFLVRQGVSTSFDYPGASNTFGLGINARGEIVGIYLDSSALNAHGFLLGNGRFHTFDFPGANTNVAACGGFGGGVTYTAGINDEGVIVGGYCGADDHYRGFLFTGESLESDGPPNPSAFRTINFPDAINSFASGINSEDKIVGGYQSADGHYHGFLLSNSEVNPVIAPSTTSQPNARPQLFTPSSIHKPLRARVKCCLYPSAFSCLGRPERLSIVAFGEDPANCLITPICRSPKSLVTKTVGMHGVLADALGPFRKNINLAFIYGSVAQSRETERSDVDLLVVGNVDFDDVVEKLADAQKTLNREINPTVYGWLEKRASNAAEIGRLLALSDGRLEDYRQAVAGKLSADVQLGLSYDAIRISATAALRAAGGSLRLRADMIPRIFSA